MLSKHFAELLSGRRNSVAEHFNRKAAGSGAGKEVEAALMISQRSFAAEEGWHEAASALMIVPQVLVRAENL